MAEGDYGRLLHEVREIGQRALFMIAGPGGVDTLASANRSAQTHLEAAVIDHHPAALPFLLEGL